MLAERLQPHRDSLRGKPGGRKIRPTRSQWETGAHSTVWQLGAVRRRRLVDPPLEAGRDERDHDGHEVDASLVPNHVCVVAVVDEAVPRLDYLGEQVGSSAM
jgi:hypothetical protein